MARPRSELQTTLDMLVDPIPVYWQAPTKMEFPCIKYERGNASDVSFADNVKYALKKGYTVTVIVRDPDSLIPDLVEGLPHCRFDRKFVVDGLHHFVYQLFF
jgi:hypothetical protein